MSACLLPDETRITRVQLRISSLARALEFYRDLLRFEVTGTAGGETWVAPWPEFEPFLALVEEPSASPRVERSTGLYHVAFRYPTRASLATTLRRLLDRGYPLQGTADHGVSEAIYLADLEGNGIELYADRPAAKWLWRDGQVAMATEPLDLGDLLRTADSAGTGAAAAPCLGHIHLHVADLTQADQLYHHYLGLGVTQRSYPGALFFAAGQYHHHLAANTWAGTATAKTGSVGLISYRLTVPVREILYCLEHRAPLFGFETRRSGELLQVRDPNGCWLEVHCPGELGDHLKTER